MTGTPTLTTGALANDTDQALTFNGTTNSMSVADSPSDSLAVVTGGAALECWLKFSAFPGSTQTVIGKAGSYELKVTSAGKLQWILTNGASTVTVTSATTLVTGSFYHVVGVFNGGYTGTTQFGNTSQVANYLTLGGDYFQGVTVTDQNLHVARFQALEAGVVTQVTAVMVRSSDATLSQGFKAVAYDGTAAPVNLLGESTPGLLFASPPAAPVAAVFGGINAEFETNDYVWLGLVGGGNSNQMMIEAAASGGTHAWRHDDVSGGDISPDAWSGSSPNPFGTVVGSDALNLVIWADYTATGRTGDEGNALLYLNGREDARSAYTAGIADTANALSFAPSVAVTLDEVSIWNKKLTAVQVAKHYNAR